MDNILLQLGVGGIFAVLIIREFVNMTSKMKGRNGGSTNGTGMLKDVKDISIDTNDRVKSLHGWHERTDNEGRPVWYFPYSIVDHQKRMADAQERTTENLKQVVQTQKDISEKLKNIDDKILH